MLTVTHPDGFFSQNIYSSNITTTKDEASPPVTRQSTVDGLGRLSQVIENPGGAPSYTTGYGYDLLDNLIAVSQGAQGRSFHYDALKRLTSATNPESGTVSYDYYAGGQLFHKTDASNITTTMSYDALNRITSKSYSDGTSAVSYTYDDPNVPFSIGRLTKVANGAS